MDVGNDGLRCLSQRFLPFNGRLKEEGFVDFI